MEKGRKKRIVGVLVNLIVRSASHGLSSVVNQLVYLPALARMFSSASYGLILTLIGVVNCIKDVLGSSLNNVRLVMNADYEKEDTKGDFNIVLVALMALGVITLFVFFFIFPEMGVVQLIILIPTVVLLIFDTYATFWFYIILDLKKTLISSMISAGGLFVGLLLVKITDLWPLANLVSAIALTIYLIKSTPVLKEPFVKTIHFKTVITKLVFVGLSSLLASMLVYLDRLILYPIIGGEAVSTYSVAVFFGKTLNIAIIPASSVLLGYISQKGFKMNLRRYWLINAGTWAIYVVFIHGVLFVSPWFTSVFYPTLYSDAEPYILIGNAAAALGSIAYITQAIALKFASTKWILIMQIIYCVIYIGLGIPFLKIWGLYGFCITMMIANGVKLLLMYVICHYYISRREIEI